MSKEKRNRQLEHEATRKETRMQDRYNDQPPEGTGMRGTSWYNRQQAVRQPRGSEEAERYARLAAEREFMEEKYQREVGWSANEAAMHDMQYVTDAPEGEREANAERVGLDYTESEVSQYLEELATERNRHTEETPKKENSEAKRKTRSDSRSKPERRREADRDMDMDRDF